MAKMFTTTKEDMMPDTSNYTVLGEAIKVEGTISGNGDLMIHGDVMGIVKTSGDVIVKNTATITANVDANNLTVGGTIHGNVTCQGQLQIQSNGKIFGDVLAKTIAIEVGAVIQGKCSAGTDQILSSETTTKK